MKKILLVMAMVVMSFSLFGASGEGLFVLSPTSGTVAGVLGSMTFTASGFTTAFTTGGKIIYTWPTGMPNPAEWAGKVTATVKYGTIDNGAIGVNSKNVTITVNSGNQFTVVTLYYRNITIPAAGSFTWGMKTASSQYATPSAATKSSVVFKSLALTATPTITATITPTMTATVSVNAPKVITAGVVLSNVPCYVNELYIEAMTNTYTGLKLIDSASLLTTAANVVYTFNYPRNATWDYFVSFNANIPKSGLFFSKGVVACTSKVAGDVLNNTITANISINKATGDIK